MRTSLFSLWLLGSVLHAQSPEQRRAIDAFRDTLQTISDSVLLQDQEERLLRGAERARADPVLHLRLGQLALRQGELGGPSHFDDAASEFNWAAELAPQWPYAWFGLGLAEYSLGARLAGNPGYAGAPRSGAWARAAVAFGRAAMLEPGLAARFEELARRAVRDHAPQQATVIREALRVATSGLPRARGARLVLALGRVQRVLGDSGALSSFEAYLASNENRPLALLELGRTELFRGELRGMTDYLAGAADEDPPSLAEYRADLLPIAGEGELADFELRRGAARAETLRRFWGRRDRLELRREGERLGEHLRRLLAAQEDFVVVNADGSERLDDRGRIYVRHGEPDDRAGFKLPGVAPNESWRYHRGGSDLVFHFVARQGLTDFRLAESVLDLAEPDAEPVRAGGASSPRLAGNTEQLLRSRTALAPVYGQARAARPEQRSRYLSDERSQGRRAIQIGTRSDSYPLRFPRELNAWAAVLVAGGSGQAPSLQVVFGIPGYAIAPATGAAGVVYPVRVRFVALDPDGAVVASVDTLTRIELPDPVPANRLLLGRVAVPVRPGRLLTHTVLQYGESAGSNFAADSVVVPAPGGGELALGDLLLGEPHGRLRVPQGNGGGTIALSPGGLVHRSAGLELGIEIFGLLPGERAELRVLLAPLDTAVSSSETPLHWRAFPDRQAAASVVRLSGSGPIVPWRASLPLRNLKAGSWVLAVELTAGAGRRARREAPLSIATP